MPIDDAATGDAALRARSERAKNPALLACDEVIASIRKKANRNKRRARASALLLTAGTALIPVSLVVSSESGAFFFGKLVPSLLAAAAAIGAAWVEIERPHERWSLYRRYERILEAERLKFLDGVEPYAGDDAELVMTTALAERQLDLHDEWAGLLPRTADVAALGGRSSTS